MSKWLDYTTNINGCLIWTRCLASDGYPRASLNGNTNIKVHREVFNDIYGYYPEVVRHTCDNPSCINPEHLVAGTQRDNIKDRGLRKRTHNHVADTDEANCKALRMQGLSYKEIGATLDIKTKRVEYILTRWRKES